MGDATHKSAISSLQEVRDLIKELPEPDLESAKKAASHNAQLTKPLGSLGKLEDLVEWLASWQAEYPPRLNHPRTSIFAGNHGIAQPLTSCVKHLMPICVFTSLVWNIQPRISQKNAQ